MKKYWEKIGIVAVFLVLGVALILTLLPVGAKDQVVGTILDHSVKMDGGSHEDTESGAVPSPWGHGYMFVVNTKMGPEPVLDDLIPVMEKGVSIGGDVVAILPQSPEQTLVFSRKFDGKILFKRVYARPVDPSKVVEDMSV